MKITICGSMNFAEKMLETKKKLEEMGHIAIIPSTTLQCIENPELNMDIEFCLKNNVQKEHFNYVVNSDAVLVLNYEKNNIKGYVGAATLMEMAIAQHFNKKIFLLYPPPKVEDLRYSVEIQLTEPIVLNGELSLLGINMRTAIDYIGVGCGALIVNDNNETLLVKRTKNSRNQAGFWSKPGGRVEFGEKVEDAIKREIKEELGVDVELTKFLDFTNQIISEEN